MPWADFAGEAVSLVRGVRDRVCRQLEDTNPRHLGSFGDNYFPELHLDISYKPARA